MSVQTSYSILTDRAYAGQLEDLNDTEVVSRKAQTSAIPFGRAVGPGTDADQCILGGAPFLGVSIRDLAREGAFDGAATAQYAVKEMVSVLRRGYINAVAPAGSVKGDAVKYNNTTGVLGAGAVGAGESIVPGATWETTTASGKVGVIRLTGQIAPLVS